MTITAAADGSALGNPGPAGWAWYVDEERWASGGWPRVAEESIVARDALLARDYGNRMHICHASTTGTVELLKWAKGQDIPLTATLEVSSFPL